MKCLAAAALAAALSVPAHAAGYRIDPAHTHVHFEVQHFGTSTIRGRFDAPAGVIDFDPASGRAEVSMTLDTASVSTGFAPLDQVLRRADLLDAQGHPQAYFVARRATLDGDRLTELRGEFTLRGVSRPLSLRALRFACRPHPVLKRELCGGDFEAELRRSDFGITHSLPFVADRVRLVIEVEAIRDDTAP